MLKTGITGTIASGKTSVSILFRKRGFAVFNSDQYAKMATHAGNPCFEPLLDLLGKDVLDSYGDIDHQKMATCIFHDEEKRKAVNAIVHPYVIRGMEHFFDSHQKDKLVFAEVPLLFEAGIESMFDQILVVTCTHDTAIARMVRDRDYTEEQAEARYRSQMPPEEQVHRADLVIHNDADLKELDHQVNLITGQLRRMERNGHQTKRHIQG